VILQCMSWHKHQVTWNCNFLELCHCLWKNCLLLEMWQSGGRRSQCFSFYSVLCRRREGILFRHWLNSFVVSCQYILGHTSCSWPQKLFPHMHYCCLRTVVCVKSIVLILFKLYRMHCASLQVISANCSPLNICITVGSVQCHFLCQTWSLQV
jgi:hypothetical protein